MDIHRDDGRGEENNNSNNNNDNNKDIVIVQSPTNSTDEGDDSDDRLEEVPVEEQNHHQYSYHDDRDVSTSVHSIPPAPVLVLGSSGENSTNNEDACFASLPTAAELRRNSNGPKYKMVSPETMRWIKLVLAVVVVFSCVLAVGVSIRRRNNNSGPTIVVTSMQVENFVLAHNLSSQADLDRPGSPQRQAVEWLAQDATHQNTGLPSPQSPQFSPGYRFLARYVLALNYFALGGANWNFALDFLSHDKDICNWNGIVVDQWEDDSNNVRRGGVFCDPITQFPIHLALPGNNLKGTLIPTENGLLTSLKSLEIENNPNLGGSIPESLCELTNLNSLYLGRNSLVNSIPSCIGEKLVNLNHLVLNNNLLDDRLPYNIAILTNLEKLMIDDNLMTGEPLPIFNSLTDLKVLMANHNEFNGFIDSGTFLHHAALEWLDLSDNNFLVPTTGIPRHLFKMESLDVLDLSKNRLSGHVPTDITTNTVLKYLSLYANDLNGGIPSELQNLEALIHLDLSDNLFHGPIRHELGNLSNLRFLYLGDNTELYTGAIPETFGNLTQMEDLSLRKTNRAGELPLFLADMEHLVYLDLGTNDFGGEIPSAYGSQLTNLEFLMLNTNINVTGNLPDSFSNLRNLRGIFIDGTGISGNVEETICELPHFVHEELDVTYGMMHVAHANCEGDINPVHTCHCCECCGFRETCSIPHQMALRSSWEQDFQLLDFEINNGTTFLNRDYIPPV